MSATYKALNYEILDAEVGYLRPRQQLPEKVTLDSPAKDVMTDLTQVSAFIIGPCASLKEAEERMIAAGVRLLLVPNQFNQILGVITSRDLSGEKPMKYVQENGGTYDEIMVRDIMTKQHLIEVIPMTQLNTARVGDLIKTLKRMGRQHAMAFDVDGEGKQTIRGIFSISQIGKQLGMDIDIVDVAGNLAKLAAAAG